MSEVIDECCNDILCPICQEVIFAPRIYDCGHSICEECMKRADETTYDESDTFSVPVFR